MRNSLLLILITILLALLAGCKREDQTKSGKPANEIAVDFYFPKAEFSEGEAVCMRVVFRNETSDTISLSEYPSSYIILDPVDGSSNAIRGIPFSCVSIAVAKEPRISQIEVGVLISLQTGDEYVAEKGKGSFLNGKPLHCSSISDISQAFMGTDLDSSEKCKELIVENENLFRAVSKRRILGSCALELGFIANGNMDLYFDVRGVLRIIDFAAGLLILSEAGGFLLDATGAPLSDQIFTLQTGFDLIAGCPGLLPIMKDLLHHNPIIYESSGVNLIFIRSILNPLPDQLSCLLQSFQSLFLHQYNRFQSLIL